MFLPLPVNKRRRLAHSECDACWKQSPPSAQYTSSPACPTPSPDAAASATSAIRLCRSTAATPLLRALLSLSLAAWLLRSSCTLRPCDSKCRFPNQVLWDLHGRICRPYRPRVEQSSVSTVRVRSAISLTVSSEPANLIKFDGNHSEIPRDTKMIEKSDPRAQRRGSRHGEAMDAGEKLRNRVRLYCILVSPSRHPPRLPQISKRAQLPKDVGRI